MTDTRPRSREENHVADVPVHTVTTDVPTVDAAAIGLLPTEDQVALAEVLRDFLSERSPEETVRLTMETEVGLDLTSWQALAGELGVCGLAVPEGLGGGGGSFADVAVVAEELGRALTCVPYLSTVVLAQSLLLEIGDEEAMRRWLPDLAGGAITATVAFAEPGQRWDATGVETTAERAGGRWRVSGTKSYVVDGHTADLVLVVARSGQGLCVLAVDGDAAGLTRTPLPTMDLTRKQARLDLEDVPAVLVGEEGGAAAAFARMLDLAAVALAVESVGGAQFALDTAVGYARTRFQFGRAIGSFQAIKHKCADMLLAVESAKSAAYFARGVAAYGDPAALPAAAALAKACCSDAYTSVAAENIQVHGGIGFTWEHSAHLYFKRATANALMFGDPATHRDRLADLLGV